MSLSVFWSIYLSPIKHSPISKNAIWDFITGIYSVIDRLLEDQLFVCAVAGTSPVIITPETEPDNQNQNTAITGFLPRRSKQRKILYFR